MATEIPYPDEETEGELALIEEVAKHVHVGQPLLDSEMALSDSQEQIPPSLPQADTPLSGTPTERSPAETREQNLPSTEQISAEKQPPKETQQPQPQNNQDKQASEQISAEKQQPKEILQPQPQNNQDKQAAEQISAENQPQPKETQQPQPQDTQALEQPQPKETQQPLPPQTMEKTPPGSGTQELIPPTSEQTQEVAKQAVTNSIQTTGSDTEENKEQEKPKVIPSPKDWFEFFVAAEISEDEAKSLVRVFNENALGFDDLPDINASLLKDLGISSSSRVKIVKLKKEITKE